MSSDGRQRVSGRNARETAYKIIRGKIINLELKPGEILNDKTLAEQLEMSRTPVREALIILSTSDMVVLKPQTGTFVAPIDTRRMEVEQFARLALEKQIVEELCEKGVSGELRWSYEENLRTYLHYADSQLPDRPGILLQLDNDFHKLAFTATGHEDNYDLQFSMQQHIERMRMLSLMTFPQEINLDDHRKVFEAVCARDRERALKQLELHLNRYRENLTTIRERYPEYFKFETQER